MRFAAGLHESLRIRGAQVPLEFTRGDALEHVVERHLLAVEEMEEGEIITSVLLLSADGRRLFHCAGPRLPPDYRRAIDGSDIGPRAGSCGTAAYFNRPVYVTDIATDLLWVEYRHLALPHGLKSCWSTPIRDSAGAVIGTFAIYRRTVSAPTVQEIEAIGMIADHVADAIMFARGADLAKRPRLTLVCDNDSMPDWQLRLMRRVERLEAIATGLDSYAQSAASEENKAALQLVAEDSRRLIRTIRERMEQGAELAH
jgi:hypothetical protein